MTNTTHVTQKPAFNWPPRRIAIFRALYLGDLVVSVPALRAIRAQFPEAEITLIGLPWAASFARRFSRYIDRFVGFPGYPGIHEMPVDPARTHRFMEEQRAYGYDLVVQMQGNGQTSNRFALALGSPVTVGYYPGVPSSGLTLGAVYPDRQPEIYRDLGLAALLGCDDLDPTLEFPLFEEERREAARFLSQAHNKSRPLIGIHPGASRPSHRWPADYFAALADRLSREAGASIFFTGVAKEMDTVAAVIDRMSTQVSNLAGRTSIGVLAALIEQCDLFISNDTGPAHIADALDTPSITLFGPVEPRRWAPLNHSHRHPIIRHKVECSPCGYDDCPIDHRCLRRIEPQTVYDTATQLLTRTHRLCNV